MEGHQIHELAFFKKQLRRIETAFSSARVLSKSARRALLYHVGEIGSLLQGTDESDRNQISSLHAGSMSRNGKRSDSPMRMKPVLAKESSSQVENAAPDYEFLAAYIARLRKWQQAPSKPFDGNPREFEQWFRP